MRRVTIVLEGGDLGAKLAIAFGIDEGIATMGYVHRRDNCVQVTGLTTDKDGRRKWVRRCRREGLTVKRAPWERGRT
jgi:hypothetical protein